MFDGVQMCSLWYPSDTHLTASAVWPQIVERENRISVSVSFCKCLSAQERPHHVVRLCIQFLLISAYLLPVCSTGFLNCPLPRDKDNSLMCQTLVY